MFFFVAMALPIQFDMYGISIHVYMYTCIHTSIHTCIHVYIHVYMYTCINMFCLIWFHCFFSTPQNFL